MVAEQGAVKLIVSLELVRAAQEGRRALRTARSRMRPVTVAQICAGSHFAMCVGR